MPYAPRRSCGHAPGIGECRACRRAREVRRPSRQERGLDAEYDRARRELAKTATHCARCRQPFGPDRRMTAGHLVPRKLGGMTKDGLQPECEACNYADGARLARA